MAACAVTHARSRARKLSVSQLTRNLSAGTTQMLVLGISDVAQAATAYRSLLAAQPGWPVLIVYRPREIASRVRPEAAA